VKQVFLKVVLLYSSPHIMLYVMSYKVIPST